jgi:signal peptidase I
MSSGDDPRTPVETAEHGDGKRDLDWPVPEQLREQPPPPAPPFSWPSTPPPVTEQRDEHDEFHHPLDRVTGRLPRRARIVVDWIVTIVGAVAIVLAIKAFVVNPYRIPSSSMEATLHCARPAPGCEARFSDRVLANRFIYHFEDPARGDIVVFKTPPAAKAKCGAGGTFVKRIIGLPGETVQIRVLRGAAYVFIDGRRLEEPYIEHDRRDIGPAERYKVPPGHYFMMGDNRSQSCDSRVWGSVPAANLIGKVFMTYWPPLRISFR